MQNKEITDVSRRKTIKYLVAAGMVGVAGSSVVYSSKATPLSLDALLTTLRSFNKAMPATTGAWPLDKMFSHCAQSIEMSMSGYPEHKSDFFKQTIGKAAFNVFGYRQKMSHGLDEPIPGAPNIVKVSAQQALTRLLNAFDTFEQYQGAFGTAFCLW